MARRRVKPSRGWVLEGGSATLTYDGSTATWLEDVMVASVDISDDDAASIQREKTSWFFKRLIFWYTVSYVPTSTGNPEGVPVFVRLGTVADDVTLQKTNAHAVPGMDFNEWGHILQDDCFMVWDVEALTRDGAALSVDTTPTATGRTFAVPAVVHKMDLSVNVGLFEDWSLIAGFGPWAGGNWVPANGDQFILDWKLKALCQKRRA